MTVPTVAVTVNLADFGGPAIDGVVVTAKMNDFDYTADNVFVSNVPVQEETVAGVAVLNVFPNSVESGLGTRGTLVKFTAYPPNSKPIKVEVRVPNEDCNLSDIVEIDPDIQRYAYVPPQQVASYAALRAYNGNRTAVYLTGNGIEGLFIRDDSDAISADNDDTVIVADNGKRWKRTFDGEAVVANYAALRGYAGYAKSARVTGYLATTAPSGISGLFTRDTSDTTSADNGATIIVSNSGVRWKRVWDGQRVHTGWFDTAGDGAVDDTTALTNAKTFAYGRHLVINKPRVEYKTGRLVWSGASANNSVIEIEGGTILRKKVDGLSVFLFQDCENIVMHANGAWAYGDWQTGEVTSSHTVQFLGCKKVVCNDLNVFGAGTTGGGKDNIYIGKGTTACEDITINGGKALYGKRNGISVVAAKRVLIDGVECAYATGAPGAGIDLESNDYTDKCEDVEVRNCHLHDNATYGFLGSFCERWKCHHNKVYNNGIHGISNAAPGTWWSAARSIDVRAVSAFATGTGRISVSGGLDTLPVGTLVQFVTTGGATVPAELQTQSRWIVDAHVAGSTTDILVSEYHDYNRKTSFATAGTGSLTTDPATSQVTMRCFNRGQSSDGEVYENDCFDNAQFDINLSLMVNLKVCRNRVRHSGDGGSSAVSLAWNQNLTYEDNVLELVGTDGGYGSYLEGNTALRCKGNRHYNFKNSGMFVIGCSRGTMDKDVVIDCGITDGRIVQITKATDMVVADMILNNRESLAIAQGLWTDATLTNSVFLRVNAKGAGTSDSNSLVISAGNNAVDCVMKSGALYNGGGTVPLMPTYTAARAYTGRALLLQVTAAGQEGFFKYDSADTTTADNGATVLVAGTKRYKRIYDGAVNVRWFGAKGDGVTNDTAAIQAAIDWAKSFVGTATEVTLAFPAGDYRVTSLNLVGASRVTLRAWGSVLINGTSVGGTSVLNIDGAGVTQTTKLNIEGNFTIGIAAGGSYQYGIKINYLTNARWPSFVTVTGAFSVNPIYGDLFWGNYLAWYAVSTSGTAIACIKTGSNNVNNNEFYCRTVGSSNMAVASIGMELMGSGNSVRGDFSTSQIGLLVNAARGTVVGPIYTEITKFPLVLAGNARGTKWHGGEVEVGTDGYIDLSSSENTSIESVRIKGIGGGSNRTAINMGTACYGLHTSDLSIDSATIDTASMGTWRGDGGHAKSFNVAGFQWVAFPATQVPANHANTLDDYEKGTGNLSLTCNTPGDMAVAAYAQRAYSYTKVGRDVTVHFDIVIAAGQYTHATASGAMRITGIPFPAGTTAARGQLDFAGITKASYTNFSVHVDPSGTYFEIYASGSGQPISTVKAADMPTGGAVELHGSITYQAAN